MRFNRAMLASAVPVLALGVAACGSSNKDSGGGGIAGSTLTVYSTLPLQGGAELQNASIVNGAKLAVAQHNGKIGTYTIDYKPLDDSLASTGAADEGQEAQNARTVVRDKTSIALLGAYNSGMTKVSLPITNKAGILQVSPTNTYVGLTTNQPGSEPGEPNKYYPTGKRTYARVVPKDTVQAAAMVSVMKADGCTSLHNFNSKTTYSAGLGRNLALSAKAQGLKFTGDDSYDVKAPNYRSLVANLKDDCISTTGESENNAGQLLKDAGTAFPKAKLYGGDAVTNDDAAKALPASIASRYHGTIATLDSSSYPAAGKKFFDEYKAKYHVKQPSTYAIYGYEAMSLILDSIQAVGDKANDRQAVVDQVLKNTKGRKSVLGTYDIDANGDTTLADYGLWKFANGSPVFDRVVKGQ